MMNKSYEIPMPNVPLAAQTPLHWLPNPRTIRLSVEKQSMYILTTALTKGEAWPAKQLNNPKV